MSHERGRPSGGRDERGPGRYACPECPETGHEFAIRSHLLDAHGWRPPDVAQFFRAREDGRHHRHGSASDDAGAFGDVFSDLFEGRMSFASEWPAPASANPSAARSAAPQQFDSDEAYLAWRTENFDRLEAGEPTTPAEAGDPPATPASDPTPTVPPEVDATDVGGVCDCDPKYKETQIIQKDTGLSLGAIGGNRETGVPVIICKNCATQFTIRPAPSGGGWRIFGRRR